MHLELGSHQKNHSVEKAIKMTENIRPKRASRNRLDSLERRLLKIFLKGDFFLLHFKTCAMSFSKTSDFLNTLDPW